MSGLGQNGGDLILQHHAFLTQLGFKLLRCWFNASFHPMNLSIDLMIFIRQADKMRVADLEVMHHVGFIWKLFSELVGNVRHKILLSENVQSLKWLTFYGPFVALDEDFCPEYADCDR